MQGSWLVQPNAPLHGPFPATICIYPSFVDINRNGINAQNPGKISQTEIVKNIPKTLKTRCLSNSFQRLKLRSLLARCSLGGFLCRAVVPHFQILPGFTTEIPAVSRGGAVLASVGAHESPVPLWQNLATSYRTCCTGGGKTSSPPGRTNGSPVDHYWWCSTHLIDLNNLWISRYLRQFDISLMLNFFTMHIWNFAWLGIILLPSYILFASSQMSKNTYPVHTIDVILVCATLLHVCHFCIHHIETVSKKADTWPGAAAASKLRSSSSTSAVGASPLGDTADTTSQVILNPASMIPLWFKSILLNSCGWIQQILVPIKTVGKNRASTQLLNGFKPCETLLVNLVIFSLKQKVRSIKSSSKN